MTEGWRVGQFPDDVFCDQRLPVRIVVDERLDMLLQEIGGDGHLCQCIFRLRADLTIPAMRTVHWLRPPDVAYMASANRSNERRPFTLLPFMVCISAVKDP